MTVKQFIEKAIEGGWRHDVFIVQGDDRRSIEKSAEHVLKERKIETIMLDPLAWQAVGKTEGKDNKIEYDIYGVEYKTLSQRANAEGETYSWWKCQMHRMIDALAEGKTIEQFLETI